jgi:hypothetical protein
LCRRTKDREHSAPYDHKNPDAFDRILGNTFFFDSFKLYDSGSRITKYTNNNLLRDESREPICIGQSFSFSHEPRKYLYRINASVFINRNLFLFQGVLLKNHPLDREKTQNIKQLF